MKLLFAVVRPTSLVALVATLAGQWRPTDATSREDRSGPAESLYVSTDAEDHPPRDFDDVMAAYDYLKTLPYVDPDRVGIMGWSHGGFITAHLVMAA